MNQKKASNRLTINALGYRGTTSGGTTSRATMA